MYHSLEGRCEKKHVIKRSKGIDTTYKVFGAGGVQHVVKRIRNDAKADWGIKLVSELCVEVSLKRSTVSTSVKASITTEGKQTRQLYVRMGACAYL